MNTKPTIHLYLAIVFLVSLLLIGCNASGQLDIGLLETQVAQGQTPIVVTQVRIVEVTSPSVVIQSVTVTPLLATETTVPLTEAATIEVTPTPLFATMPYTIQPNDTPMGVALTFGIDLSTLIALNADVHPEMGNTPIKFNAGWQIVVPFRENVVLAAISTQAVIAAQPTATSVTDGNGGVFNYDVALEIVRLTNEARVAAGVGMLSVDEGLMALARERAVELVTGFNHDGFYDEGCENCGENITKGSGSFYSATAMFNEWVKSASHHQNMLYGGYSAMGTAYYKYKAVTYGVQVFR